MKSEGIVKEFLIFFFLIKCLLQNETFALFFVFINATNIHNMRVFISDKPL